MKYFIPYLFAFFIPLAMSHSQGYVAALGGGSVPDHVYEWMVEKSDNGKIVVLSYSDASNSLPEFFKSLGASDSYNITIDSRDKADQQSIYDEIVSANAVYLRGGNQWIYVRDWKSTRTEEAIREVFNSGGVVGGTSAGAMVLSEYVFTARYGTVYPPDALQNPTAVQLDLESDFINVVSGALIDTHFIERGRFGRLIPFLFKLYVQRGANVLGIGIDDQTALCIDSDGIGTVKGTGAVAFYTITGDTFIASSPQGYTLENIKVDQLVEDWQYNIVQREILSMPGTAKQVDTEREWELPATTIWLSGQDDVAFNVTNLMPYFFEEHDPDNLLIITTPGYCSSLTPLTEYLEDEEIPFTIYETGSGSPSAIEAAEVMLFAGHNPVDFVELTEGNASVADAISQKIYVKTPIILFGNAGKLAGALFVNGVDEEEWAAYLGKMTLHNGLSAFGDFIFQPSVFDDIDFYENRSSSVLWGLMKNRSRLGLYLQPEAIVSICAQTGVLRRYNGSPYLIVDAKHTEWVDSSRYRTSGSVGPRQVVAMTGLLYHVSSIEENYSIEAGEFGIVTSKKEDIATIPAELTLQQNYPNPFNNQTIILFSIPRENHVKLQVYDILGNKITTILNSRLSAGRYDVSFDTTALPVSISSGVYFYRLQTDSGSIVRKMLYVR